MTSVRPNPPDFGLGNLCRQHLERRCVGDGFARTNELADDNPLAGLPSEIRQSDIRPYHFDRGKVVGVNIVDRCRFDNVRVHASSLRHSMAVLVLAEVLCNASRGIGNGLFFGLLPFLVRRLDYGTGPGRAPIGLASLHHDILPASPRPVSAAVMGGMTTETELVSVRVCGVRLPCVHHYRRRRRRLFPRWKRISNVETRSSLASLPCFYGGVANPTTNFTSALARPSECVGIGSRDRTRRMRERYARFSERYCGVSPKRRAA